jgi:hypothetical protein
MTVEMVMVCLPLGSSSELPEIAQVWSKETHNGVERMAIIRNKFSNTFL